MEFRVNGDRPEHGDPRTRAATRLGLGERLAPGRRGCLAPQPYLDTLSLVAGARVVLTDSGGLPEEGRWRAREDQPIPL